MRPCSWVLIGALLVGLACPVAFAADEPPVSEQVHAIEIDLGNVENGIRRLEREVENPVAHSRFYPMEKRLVDARVYFELKNYGKAAVMYMDAITHAEFRNHTDRPGILFRLGLSLFKLKNYRGARTYLEQLIAIGGGEYYPRGLRYLIEIGLETRSGDGLKESVQRAGRVAGRTSELQYAWAKGLFRLGRTQEALGGFASVAQGKPEYPAAQYYAGVILTERSEYPAALAAFRRVITAGAVDTDTKQIRELAHLGIGRLNLELKDYTNAIDAYQEIDRHSEHFHTALYEMTWAYVNSEQFDKALNSLEVLLLTVEDEQLATQANILRGRLNIMLEQTDLAIETYNDIIARFSPLRDELDTFARKQENLVAYFRWLLRRHSDAFQLGAVMSDRASSWIEHDEQLGDVVGLFDEMSLQRRDVGDAEGILRELETALASGNRVEIFPNLKHSWTRIIVAENQLVHLSQRVLDAGGRLARTQMSANERGRLDELLARRRQLEEEFARVPQTVQAFNQRKLTVHRRYAELRRESFFLEQSLEQVRKELQAMERWINEARFGQQGSTQITQEQEQQLLALLEEERAKLLDLHNELVELKDAIGRQNAAVGAGDFVTQDETALRRRLLDAHREEEILLSQVLNRLAGPERQQGEQLGRLRVNIVNDFKRLGTLLRKINEAVELKIADYRRQLRAEERLLAGYRREVEAFDRDSDRIAREIGVPLFKLAHQRITDVVLEADLGLVDVAWNRKLTESNRIRSLQEEQSEQLRNLEETMRQILKD